MIIEDSLYGHIQLNDLCTKFASVFEFQRLEYIKNTYSHPKYTGLNVSRKEHSYGVMYLATILGTKLNATPKQIELLSLAGLYHDIGHISTSHLLDELLIAKGIPNHEIRSVEVLYQVNSKLNFPLSEEDLLIVSNMILGIGNYWLYEIVHNKNTLLAHDVDRLDYLNRDGFHINNLQVNALEELQYYMINKDDHLCMPLACFEHVKTVRTYMFENIYHCLESTKQKEELKIKLVKLIEYQNININSWLQMTDAWFFNLMACL